ncbi:flippase activity-associated protein Agl23, partial [Halorussus litoreus]|uniref:flippase activity-associated protein Agl23 n=1 Tax=Halorussus litoreus TaxID=1710536 RepID=UPI000E282A67
ERAGGPASALVAARDRVVRTARGVWAWRGPFGLAVVEFVAIVVFFYAPRGEGAAVGPTLGETARDPTLLPALVGEATVGSWHRFTGRWVGGNESSYLDTATALWPALETGAPVVVAFAIVGFLADRYADGGPRDVVAFCSYWGFASLLGYPVIVENAFPWEIVHVAVPLVIPAAVGVALVARVGLASVADADRVSAVAAAVVLLVAAAGVGATGASTAYLHPQSDDELVQYAQSSSEMKPLLREVDAVAETNDGIDVLYYGEEFYAADETRFETPRPKTYPAWFERLSFAWYFETAGAEVDSTTHSGVLARDPPPVVVAPGSVETCDEEYANASDVDRHLSGYDRHEVQRYLHDSGCIRSSVVVFVDPAATNASVAEENRSAARLAPSRAGAGSV